MMARGLAGCLVALLFLPLGMVVLVAIVVGTILGAVLGGGPAGRPVGAAPARCAGNAPATIRTASIRDLCHGPSDATRLARVIAAIRPDSPLVGLAATIVELSRRYGIDPLLIVQWQGESQMATDGPPVSANGPDNGGNLTWAAAEPYAAEWGCAPGAEVRYADGTYLFARCPSVAAGVGLWFAYVAGRYPAAQFSDLAAYANVYNSCAYPGNAANGFLCGDAYAQHILDLLDAYAGAPVVVLPAPGGDDGGYVFPVAGYTGAIELHWGSYPGAADLFASEGMPVLAMRGGRVDYADYDATGGWAILISGTDGLQYWYAHLRERPPVGTGQTVAAGDPLGLVGRTGNADGGESHLHLGIGPRILTGTGPTGGAGSDNFDAVGLLRAVYACCRR